jgi:hypothetical protein
MNDTTTNLAPSAQTQPIEVVNPNPSPIANPDTWMRNGDSPAEIITAVAVLIGAITGLLQVLLPHLLKRSQQQANKKTK